MNTQSLWGLAVAILLAMASPAVAGQSLKLGSGKSVEILTVGPMPSSQGRPALALKYRSKIPGTDETAQRKEADEIWQRFVPEAERGKYETAVITASQPKGSSHDFTFAKKDGVWRTYESKGRQKAKLDRDFVVQFVDRLDWLFEHQETDALRLYLASDWTLTSTNAAEGRLEPKTDTVAEFMQSLEALSAAVNSYRHKREIVGIVLDAGRTTARVTSREFEDIVDADNHVTTSSHSVDVVELTGDGFMLLKQSENAMDKMVKERAAQLAPTAPRLPRHVAAAAQE